MIKKQVYPGSLIMTLMLIIVLSISTMAAAENDAVEKPGPAAVSDASSVSGSESAQYTLKDLLALAYQNNPSIKAGREKWQAVIERYPQVTTWPDAKLMYSFFPSPLETRLGPQYQRLKLSQAIPGSAKLKFKGEVVKADVSLARLGYEKVVRDTLINVEKSYFELLYLRQAEQITRDNLKLISELANLGEADYATDVTTLNDVLKAQAQEAQLTYDLLLLEDLAEVEEARLYELLGQEVSSPLSSITDYPLAKLNLTEAELLEYAYLNRLELKLAARKITRAEKVASLKLKEKSPDYMVELMYLTVGESMMKPKPKNSGRDAIGIGLGMSLPFGKSSYRASHNEARIKLAKARHEYTAVLNQTRSKIKRALFKLNNAERLVRLYSETLLAQALDALSKAETLYREGAGSYSGLIETQSIWLNFNLAAARARTDYLIALAGLEELCGVNLIVTEPSP